LLDRASVSAARSPEPLLPTPPRHAQRLAAGSCAFPKGSRQAHSCALAGAPQPRSPRSSFVRPPRSQDGGVGVSEGGATRGGGQWASGLCRRPGAGGGSAAGHRLRPGCGPRRLHNSLRDPRGPVSRLPASQDALSPATPSSGPGSRPR
jgi:hypothetical protein